MAGEAEKNKAIVLEYLDAFRTWDPARYEPYLTEHPVYQVGMTVHEGRKGFADVAHFGRTLYPNGQSGHTYHNIIAEGDSVAILMTVEAVTNKGADYRNIYAVVFDLEDGRIARQTEILDFRVAADKFDLSALA